MRPIAGSPATVHSPTVAPSATWRVLALLEPLHGYGIMQKVDQLSQGTVTVGPGTLYGALSSLEKESLIVKEREEERRKVYALTDTGRCVLAAQVARLEIMTRAAAAALLGGSGT